MLNKSFLRDQLYNYSSPYGPYDMDFWKYSTKVLRKLLFIRCSKWFSKLSSASIVRQELDFDLADLRTWNLVANTCNTQGGYQINNSAIGCVIVKSSGEFIPIYQQHLIKYFTCTQQEFEQLTSTFLLKTEIHASLGSRIAWQECVFLVLKFH